jgi:hypothetical protein
MITEGVMEGDLDDFLTGLVRRSNTVAELTFLLRLLAWTTVGRS